MRPALCIQDVVSLMGRLITRLLNNRICLVTGTFFRFIVRLCPFHFLSLFLISLPLNCPTFTLIMISVERSCSFLEGYYLQISCCSFFSFSGLKTCRILNDLMSTTLNPGNK